MGGLIDCLLFTPQQVEKEYYIFDGTKPTASLGNLVDIILNNYQEIPPINKIVEIGRNAGLWSKVVKEETYINKFDVPDFWTYLTAQFSAKGKVILSQDQFDLAEEVVRVLKTHPYSKGIVAYPSDDEDKYVQYEIEYELDGVILRGILDLLVINHKAKTVRMIDLKTGAPKAEEFSGSFVKYRYYLQEAVYIKAFEYIVEALGLKGYTLLPFQFLYVSRYEKLPLVYTVPESWHKAALYGFTTKSGYYYKGLHELINDIKWHFHNNKFELSRNVYEQNGLITLNDDFIEVDE